MRTDAHFSAHFRAHEIRHVHDTRDLVHFQTHVRTHRANRHLHAQVPILLARIGTMCRNRRCAAPTGYGVDALLSCSACGQRGSEPWSSSGELPTRVARSAGAKAMQLTIDAVRHDDMMDLLHEKRELVAQRERLRRLIALPPTIKEVDEDMHDSTEHNDGDGDGPENDGTAEIELLVAAQVLDDPSDDEEDVTKALQDTAELGRLATELMERLAHLSDAPAKKTSTGRTSRKPPNVLKSAHSTTASSTGDEDEPPDRRGSSMTQRRSTYREVNCEVPIPGMRLPLMFYVLAHASCKNAADRTQCA